MQKIKKCQKIAETGAIILCLTAFFSCASVPSENPAEFAESDYIPENPEWMAVNECEAVKVFSFENPALPIRYTAVKINLAAKNLELAVYPNSDTNFCAEKNYTHRGIHIQKFQKRTQALIAVNTSPYSSPRFPFSSHRRILGVFKADGILFSAPVQRYAALIFSRDENRELVAKCTAHQSPQDAENDFAVGGFFMILKDGELFDSTGKNFSYTSRSARTAAGISESGQTLFLLATERSAKSTGLTYPECAKLLRSLGAKNALEFDGGGSTAMMIGGKNALESQSRRKNASYIGFLFSIKGTF